MKFVQCDSTDSSACAIESCQRDNAWCIQLRKGLVIAVCEEHAIELLGYQKMAAFLDAIEG